MEFTYNYQYDRKVANAINNVADIYLDKDVTVTAKRLLDFYLLYSAEQKKDAFVVALIYLYCVDHWDVESRMYYAL